MFLAKAAIVIVAGCLGLAFAGYIGGIAGAGMAVIAFVIAG